ncbi:MAG: tRNA threonylcarbamoyladenosine dehydratase [Curvibacter sp. RIFCSPHIGHO2_12_FULL_63_18]|uniref:tRNA threonylcarbamoyladenosine dehydratase n=1 Tax=Rhodoferax sp. TaxID=50421 RepID=UPI0008B08308|nr:tRNA threonylcarbamoyladenosine dehydratase [Rhodoferax sp.]OGO96948.1 MAG: tRNA threonylcarbamoyladenosine dehydratase [Curvibacter sp. GWA2_63_95]OGP01124.1 MAG: tRNA threonylcarbamoyladenosine dehydratase [Curvibacter sp. RIFCSPHIGHO2_12_FULL_63_18]HCX80712.1 tRNA threonylcarbamoyladenosine dehydratase [Rhodoferax sp.]
MTDSPAPADLVRRFSGLDRLLGLAPAERVRHAHVMVVGIGGVGSWAAEALARSGVGRLTLVDMDHVSESNINRQLHALSSTLGMAKIEAMRQRIALINPACEVCCLDTFADAENWASLVAEGVDAVLDACDQVRTKTVMAAWAVQTKTPFITVGAAGGKRMAHAVDIADLSETTHDPLLAQVRYRLRREHGAPKNGKKIQVACVFSKEAVAGPDASCAVESDGSLNCHGYGSLVTVTATFGMCAAGWIIDKISRREPRSEKNTL